MGALACGGRLTRITGHDQRANKKMAAPGVRVRRPRVKGGNVYRGRHYEERVAFARVEIFWGWRGAGAISLRDVEDFVWNGTMFVSISN